MKGIGPFFQETLKYAPFFNVLAGSDHGVNNDLRGGMKLDLILVAM